MHLARWKTKRLKVLSFDVGFHGRTPGSLAATGLQAYRKRLTTPEDPRLNGFIRFSSFEDLELIDPDTACVLCESIPSLGGVLMPPEGYYTAGPLPRGRCSAGFR